MGAQLAICMSSQTCQEKTRKILQKGYHFLGNERFPEDLKDHETCLVKDGANGEKEYIAIDQDTGTVRPLQSGA